MLKLYMHAEKDVLITNDLELTFHFMLKKKKQTNKQTNNSNSEVSKEKEGTLELKIFLMLFFRKASKH